MGSFPIYLARLDGTKTRAVRIGTADTMAEAQRFAEEFARDAGEHLSSVDRDRIEIRWKNTTETVSVKWIGTSLTER